jgi:hypothetical protein
LGGRGVVEVYERLTVHPSGQDGEFAPDATRIEAAARA